jgi:Tfp pilus assembly protein PilF
LSLRPAHAEAHINLAFALAETGDHAGAQNHFEQAIDLDGTYAYPYCSYARYLLDQSDAEKIARARPLLERALQVEPQSAAAHHLTARAAQAAGDADSAVASYEKSIALNGDNFQALMALGQYALERGDSSGAARYFVRAAVLDKTNPGAYLGAGQAFRQSGRPDRALRSLWQAESLDPGNPATEAEMALTTLGIAIAKTEAMLTRPSELSDEARDQLLRDLEQLKTLHQAWEGIIADR